MKRGLVAAFVLVILLYSLVNVSAVSCGDNHLDVDMGEVCDGAALGGNTCTSVGFTGGTLKCSTDCKSFDTSGCTKSSPPAGGGAGAGSGSSGGGKSQSGVIEQIALGELFSGGLFGERGSILFMASAATREVIISLMNNLFSFGGGIKAYVRSILFHGTPTAEPVTFSTDYSYGLATAVVDQHQGASLEGYPTYQVILDDCNQKIVQPASTCNSDINSPDFCINGIRVPSSESSCDSMIHSTPTRTMYMFCKNYSDGFECTGGCAYSQIFDATGGGLACWGIADFDMQVTKSRANMRCEYGNNGPNNEGLTDKNKCPWEMGCSFLQGQSSPNNAVYNYPETMAGKIQTQLHYTQGYTLPSSSSLSQGGGYENPVPMCWNASFIGFSQTPTGCAHKSSPTDCLPGNTPPVTQCPEDKGFRKDGIICRYVGTNGEAVASKGSEKPCDSDENCTVEGEHCNTETKKCEGAAAATPPSGGTAPSKAASPVEAIKQAAREALGLKEPDHCSNGLFDGDETGTDCGGSCSNKCDICQRCKKDSDCATGYCGKAMGVQRQGCIGFIGICYSPVVKTFHFPCYGKYCAKYPNGFDVSVSPQGFAFSGDIKLIGYDNNGMPILGVGGGMYGSPDKSPTPNKLMFSGGGPLKNLNASANASGMGVSVNPITLPDGSDGVEIGLKGGENDSGIRKASLSLSGTDENGNTIDFGSLDFSADVKPASENPAGPSKATSILTISFIILAALATIGIMLWLYRKRKQPTQ